MNNRTKIFQNKWILLSSTIVVILMMGLLFIFSKAVTAHPEEDGTILLEVQDKESGVSYGIGVDNLNNEVNGIIDYERNTVEDIEKYSAFNNQELDKILKNSSPTKRIPLQITFNTPLNEEAFTKFVEQYDLEVEYYIIYMLEPSGNIVTIQGGPSEEKLVPTEFFNMATDNISQEQSPGSTFLGWVSVKGNVQVSRVRELQNDPHVYLAGVMELFVKNLLTDELLANAGYAPGIRSYLLYNGFTTLSEPGLSWSLYYLGIMKDTPQP